MVSDKEKVLEIMNQIIQYKDRMGYFSMPLAIESSSRMDPGKTQESRIILISVF